MLDYESSQSQTVEMDLIVAQKRIAFLENQLEESQRHEQEEIKRFQNLFEMTPLGYQSLDAEGNFLEVNASWLRSLGYEKEEVLGKNFAEFLTPEWKEHFSDNFPRFKAIGEVLGVEFEMVRKDGSTLLVSFTGKIGRDSGGEFKQTHCVLRDISDENAKQKALQEAMATAQAANKAKSDFLASMSHEIRTPLNGILGMLQLMETTALDVEQKEYVHAAMASSDRLNHLLSDILDLSRVEAKKMELAIEPLDLKKIVKETCQLFELSAGQAGIDLSCDIDSTIPNQLLGDKLRIQQVLSNLIGNSLKYTFSGQIRVGVYPLHYSNQKSARFLFMVTDTGIGIPDDMIDILFQPFTQASNGYSRQYEGAGLGLSICRRLVGLMGGDIAVETEVDKGTGMYFSLPMECAKVEQEDAEAPSVSPKKTVDAAGTKILVVEDDYVNGYAIRVMLEKNGFETYIATNGVKALNALITDEFDLVLMDIQMPEMDGIEATEAIRKGETGEKNTSIPIIAMTAYAMTGDKEIFLNAGMDHYLPKPVDKAALLRTIGKVLSVSEA